MQPSNSKNILIIILAVLLCACATALFFIKSGQDNSTGPYVSAPVAKENKIADGPAEEVPSEPSVVDKEVIQINEPGQTPPPVPEPPITRDEIWDTYVTFIDAWNNKDYNTQARLLSPDFIYVDDKESGNKATYLQKKSALFNKYEWITVEASDEQVSLQGNTGSVTYYQHYDSPVYQSWGNNTFFFKKTNGVVRIYKEVFRPFRRERKSQ
ncbi:MAG: nuclear transport factor 2 family protein [Ferruginibacter sp.]